MNGLLLYKQYLENIRECLINCTLDELSTKSFLDILKRESEIEDLIYIDDILKNAGLDISFIGTEDFLNQKVVVQSKIKEILTKDNENIDEDFEKLLLDSVSIEDDLISQIQDILDGKNEVKELEGFEEESYTAEDIINKNKDMLESLFQGMEKYSDIMKEKEEKKEDNVIVEDDFTFSNDSDDEEIEEVKENIKKDIDKEDVEDKENVEDIVDKSEENVEDLRTENIEQIEKNKAIDDIFDTDIEELEENQKEKEDKQIENEDIKSISFKEDEEIDLWSQNEEDIEKDEDDSEEANDEDIEKFKEKDFSNFIKPEVEEEEIGNNNSKTELKNEEELDNFTFDDESLFERFEESDNTGKELEEDLKEDEGIESFDPDTNRFEDATNYFLNGVKQSKNKNVEELKELSRKKEKLVDSDKVSSTDDALAKVLLGAGAGLLSIPDTVTKIVKGFSGIKEKGKSLKDNFIVKDDEDE